MTAKLTVLLGAEPVTGTSDTGRLMLMPMRVVLVPRAVVPSIERVCEPMSIPVGMVSSAENCPRSSVVEVPSRLGVE